MRVKLLAGLLVVAAVAGIGVVASLDSKMSRPIQWVFHGELPGQGPPTLVEGSLTVFSASLVHCDSNQGLWGRIAGFFGSDLASAGHGEELDSSGLLGPIEVDLLAESAQPLGGAELTSHSYCQAHVGLAGAAGSRVDGRVASGEVTLSAVFEADSGEANETELVAIETGIPWAALDSINPDADWETASDVVVSMDTSAFVDGIDLELTGDDLERSALRSAAAAIEVAPAADR